MSGYDRFKEEYVRLTEMGVTITSKDKSLKWLWKFIHYFLLVITFGKMSNFYSDFTTTFGKGIYFPDGWTPENAGPRGYIVLRHEGKHVRDYIKYGLGSSKLGIVVMGFLYLFIPIFIGFSWFRLKFEREAYLEGILAWSELGVERDIEPYVGLLTGPEYFWAWHSKKQVRDWFNKELGR